jgi:hydrogenase maturation protease
VTGPAPPTIRHVVVFACGEPMRGDDAAAATAVAGLGADVLARADVRIVTAIEPETLVELRPGTALVVVDAVTGVAAGRIVTLDLADLEEVTRVSPLASPSTHQLPLQGAIRLAELLRGAPLEGRFVGVGAGRAPAGGGLSEAVTAALPGLRAAIAEAVDYLAAR